jgi:hypothetical protein
MNQYNGVLLIPSISISTNIPGGRADINFYEVIMRKLVFFLEYCKNNNLQPVFIGRLTTQKLSISTLNKMLHLLKGSDAILYDEHIFLKNMMMDENNITGVLINAGVLHAPASKELMKDYYLNGDLCINIESDNKLFIQNSNGERVDICRDYMTDGQIISDRAINTGVATRTLFCQQYFTPNAWEITGNLNVSRIIPPYNSEVFYDAKVISDEAKRLASSSNFASQLKEAIEVGPGESSIGLIIEDTMKSLDCRSEVREKIYALMESELEAEPEDDFI